MNDSYNESAKDNGGAPSQENLGISSDLLAILVCPVDHAELEVTRDGLHCTTCGRIYPVDKGIPNFLIED